MLLIPGLTEIIIMTHKLRKVRDYYHVSFGARRHSGSLSRPVQI